MYMDDSADTRQDYAVNVHSSKQTVSIKESTGRASDSFATQRESYSGPSEDIFAPLEEPNYAEKATALEVATNVWVDTWDKNFSGCRLLKGSVAAGVEGVPSTWGGFVWILGSECGDKKIFLVITIQDMLCPSSDTDGEFAEDPYKFGIWNQSGRNNLMSYSDNLLNIK